MLLRSSIKYRDEKQRNGSRGRVWNECGGNETRIMWYESCRLPVTVLVGLPVTVILPSVPQNR